MSLRHLSTQEAKEKRHARMGIVFSLLMFSRIPRRYSLFQSAMSIHLWCEGATHSLIETLSYFGMSQGVNAARGHVDRLAEKHDRKVVEWKDAIEGSNKVVYMSLLFLVIRCKFNIG